MATVIPNSASAVALSSATAVRAFSALVRLIGISPACRNIPIENALAGPKRDVAVLADMSNGIAEIAQAVRHSHDVGMDNERHHARRAPGILVDLIELVDGALTIFDRCMVLDQHHRDVVAFLRV